MATHPPDRVRAALPYLILILWVGAALRVPLLAGDIRFHPDEAFFAAFARNAAARGEWWLPGPLDKTPLAIYLQALSMLAVGIRWEGAVWVLPPPVGEFAARLPSLYASLILIALTARLGRALVPGRAAALTAAALMALSPFGIAFGAVAFTDTPMLAAALGAVLCALHRRARWAAFWFVIAVAAKQQALFFLPLLLILLKQPSALRRFLVVFTVGMGVLLIWDALRPGASVWLLAQANNQPGELLVPLTAQPARLSAWWVHLRHLSGSAGTLLLLGLSATALFRRITTPALRHIALFVTAYAALHIIVPLNTYDRYLLPLVPLWFVLAATWTRHRAGVVLLALVLLLGLPTTLSATRAELPIGGDRGEHAGMPELAAYLNSREFGAIIYDRWLGWELNYYLGAWSDKRRAFYPSPLHMLTDPAPYLPDVAPRYVPAPNDAEVRPWLLAWHLMRFRVCVGYTSPRFQVYVLTRPPASDAASSAGDLTPSVCDPPLG